MTTQKILLWGAGLIGAWWLADHVAIDQGGTGFSFPYRTDADKRKLEESKQAAALHQLPAPFIPRT